MSSWWASEPSKSQRDAQVGGGTNYFISVICACVTLLLRIAAIPRQLRKCLYIVHACLISHGQLESVTSNLFSSSRLTLPSLSRTSPAVQWSGWWAPTSASAAERFQVWGIYLH